MVLFEYEAEDVENAVGAAAADKYIFVRSKSDEFILKADVPTFSDVDDAMESDANAGDKEECA